MSTPIENNFEQIKPIVKMLIPMFGGLEGLQSFFLKASPSLNNSLDKFLDKKKEEHIDKFQKGGFNTTTLSFVKFGEKEPLVLIMAIRFNKDSSIKDSKILESISTRELIKRLISAIPLEELEKEL